jgi:DNA-binding CsgD family transcriptional regulator
MFQPQKETTPSFFNLHLIPHYWQSLKPSVDVPESLVDEWKRKVEFMDEVSIQNNAVVFLWNAYTNRFLYMSDKLKIFSGIDPALFTGENGVENVLNHIHPDHVRPVLLMIQQLVINFCADYNVEDYKEVKICFNYLFRNDLGEYMQILQRPVILEVDEQNKPMLILNSTYHVEYIKRPGSVGGMVIYGNKTYLFDYNSGSGHIEPVKSFSLQEITVLQLLGKGFDTKTIAEKLFISPNTVDTHRRNLIRKANCMDTTGVVAFARMTGLI